MVKDELNNEIYVKELAENLFYSYNYVIVLLLEQLTMNIMNLNVQFHPLFLFFFVI
jgi:hypothetical protein